MSKTDDIEHALRMLNAAFADGRDQRGGVRAPGRPAAGPAGGDSRLVAGQGRGPHTRETFPAPSIVPAKAERRLRPSRGLRRATRLPRRPIRLDLPSDVIRRRGLAYGGMLPPAIAKTFTVGQAAVLSVVAWEHLHHGACRKSYAEIADEAGCSRRWVKATIGLAKLAGIIGRAPSPRPGGRTTRMSSASSPSRLARLDQDPRRAAGEGPSRGGNRGKQGSHLT